MLTLNRVFFRIKTMQMALGKCFIYFMIQDTVYILKMQTAFFLTFEYYTAGVGFPAVDNAEWVYHIHQLSKCFTSRVNTCKDLFPGTTLIGVTFRDQTFYGSHPENTHVGVFTSGAIAHMGFTSGVATQTGASGTTCIGVYFQRQQHRTFKEFSIGTSILNFLLYNFFCTRQCQ